MVYETHEISHGKYTAPLHTYLLSNSNEIAPDRKRPLVLICPGGAYAFTSDREAEPVAVQLNAMGIHACILRYSCAPARFPTALVQVAKSIALIRENAAKWNVDPDKIAVMGFSAGGHLACSIGTFWNRKFLAEEAGLPSEAIRPNGLVLSYPVISAGQHCHAGSFQHLLGKEASTDAAKRDSVSLEKQVDPDMPKTFIWHTFADESVPVENTLLLLTALKQQNIPFEAHIFPDGPHGISLGTEETISPDRPVEFMAYPELTPWISMAGRWIKAL